MDTTLITTIVSTGGAVIVGVTAMFFNSNLIGKRIDDLRQEVRDLRGEFNAFRDMANGKLSAIDLEIARLRLPG